MRAHVSNRFAVVTITSVTGVEFVEEIRRSNRHLSVTGTGLSVTLRRIACQLDAENDVAIPLVRGADIVAVQFTDALGEGFLPRHIARR